MTQPLFRDDAYQRDAAGSVVELTQEGGIVLDQTVFYPTGGGQPGDSGALEWDGKRIEIATSIKGHKGEIVLVPAAPTALPAEGTIVQQRLDWDRRHRHMRIHTALHLLSVVLPLPVTGGQIGMEKGRLDFAMPEPPEDRQAIEDALNHLIDLDLPVSERWITTAELEANPGLVKTLSVAPPRNGGDVRLVAIGEKQDLIDLQPCGGTHVARTSEIGRIRLGRIENKGKQNRRVHIHLD